MIKNEKKYLKHAFLFLLFSFLHNEAAANSSIFYFGDAEPADYACENKSAFLYTNSLYGNIDEEKNNRRMLQLRLNQFSREIAATSPDVILAFNTNLGFISEFIELLILDFENANIDFFEEIMHELFSLDPGDFGLGRTKGRLVWFNLLWTIFEQQKYIDTAQTSRDFATHRHAKLYNGFINKGRNIAALPHGQGNLFTNEAYEKLYDPMLDSFQITAVGSPLGHVAGFGPYILLEEDVLMQTLSQNDWNVDNYLDYIPNPIRGHSFRRSYMDKGSNSERKILSTLASSVGVTKQNKCRTPLLTLPSSLTYKTQRVLDNGKRVDIADTIGNVQLYNDFPLIDWRGSYEDGKATKAISYHGPAARFNGTGTYFNYIYRDGQVFYRLPEGYQILGAAITTIEADGLQEDWVVAVATLDGKTDTVFKRRIKMEQGLQVVDLYDGLVADVDNPDSPYWIKVKDIQHSIDSELYAPWFFNGDGTEAQTLRRLKTSLFYSTDNDCPVYGYEFYEFVCEAHTYPAGSYVVTVLNRHKISLAKNLTAADVSDLGFESGNTGLLGVDYLDDQELLLRVRNNENVDTYLWNTRWLDVNGEKLMDERVLNCSYDGVRACRRGNGDTVFGANIDGLITGWEVPEDGRQFSIAGSVDLHLYYLDLRTNYYEFSLFEADIANNPFLRGDASYYYSYLGSDPVLMGRLIDVEPGYVGIMGYSTSAYGYESSYDNWLWGADPTIRGQYQQGIPLLSRRHKGIYTAPKLLAAGRVVEPDGHYVISNRMQDGSTFNYYSKRDLESLLGENLTGKTVLPVALN